MTVTITDEQIDACGFRMFVIPEIARTMAMYWHPDGSRYIVKGNQTEQMLQLGNAVTPPVTTLLIGRLQEVIGEGATFIDLFCGAGGSSIGAEIAGATLRLGLNHSRIAIETHSINFPHADHDCADVSALTTRQIRKYPDSDILLASPECTNHSIAKGGKRKKPQGASLFDDGPAADGDQDRSRATMWDVVRFTEQKILKGNPYKAIIVENVTDAFKWGADDDGGLFAAWRMAMTNLGYESEIVWLNSMFVPPTPQSRDRMYVVYWRKGIRRPNLRIEPISWCPGCERIVEGRQSFKRSGNPHYTKAGMPVGARYGAQYLYTCPDCHGVVLPGACPAITAIDLSIPAPIIGERKDPLAVNTRERIRRGLWKVTNEEFEIKTVRGNPSPLTLPLVWLDEATMDAMVIPASGNTFERTPGNRARNAELRPMDTIHGSLQQALVVPNRMNNVPRDAEREASAPVMTGGTLSLVYANRKNGSAEPAREHPTAGVMASGGHMAVVVAHYDPGWARRADLETFGSVTTRDGHSLVVPYSTAGVAKESGRAPVDTITQMNKMALVVPYQSDAHDSREPIRTVVGRGTTALVIPPMGQGSRDADRDPGTAQTTTTRAAVVTRPGA